MLQASQFNNVLGTNRRKMPRRLCRLKSRTWETTTSASWRNPTAPPPSSRSSPSGCSTPSTWTESRPPAARLQVLDHYGSGSATQSKFSPARKQKNMFIWKKKKKTHNLNCRLLSRAFTNQCQTRPRRRPCGSVDSPPPTTMTLWRKGASVGIRHSHFLAACTPFLQMLQFVSMWWVVGFPAWQTTKDVETHPKEMGFKLSG